MTGFLCRTIFWVRAEILIFGEIYTSAFIDAVQVPKKSSGAERDSHRIKMSGCPLDSGHCPITNDE